jgi:FkbM family methyltransferase
MGIPLIFQKFVDLFIKSNSCNKFGNKSCYHIDSSILSENSIIYSAGVGKDISFELEIEKKFHSKIFLFDPSPTGEKTINSFKNLPLKFINKGIAGNTGRHYFSKPDISQEGSYKKSKEKSDLYFDCISISDFAKYKRHKQIDLLKMDVEGFEYEVIDDILKNGPRIKQIVLEFHHFLKEIPYSRTIKSIIKLRKAGYRLIYKDVDNYTFILNENSEDK